MLALATAMIGCGRLPDVSYETDRLHIATEFDEPICAATLAAFDEHVDGVEQALGQPHGGDPIVVYWLDDVTEQCGKGRFGCFFPGTRVLFSTGPSITHEIVHAVLDSTAKTYFVEEGMAEMFSGVDVWYRPDPEHGRPADALRLTTSAYRDGKLDYAAAAHFMRFVYETGGELAMRALAEVIVDGGDAGAIEATLEQSFGAPIEQIEGRYFDDSRVYYRGFAAGGVPASEDFYSGDTVRLDCDDENTRGPLISGGGGLYQVKTIRISADAVVDIEVDGDAGGWVDLFDPTARRGIVTNWGMPRADVDPDALHLVPGERVKHAVRRGTYLAVFGADVDGTEVKLTLRRPLPPSSHPEEAG
ncbi:MAG: hypothetical protein IAG13_29785 [Deltaproteobacteria bacterium]|nr:hypothetical protein [Nannocystaceae bacterium]